MKKNWISKRQVNRTCWHCWPYKLTWHAFVVNLHAIVQKNMFIAKKGKKDIVLVNVQTCLQMEDKRNQLILGQAKLDVLVLQLE